MPVEDHAVHEKTRIGTGYKYGCWNRKPFAPGYVALDRYYKQDGTFVVTQRFIQHRMSETCRYDMASKDKHCEGCGAPKDEEYKKRMSAL